MTRVAVVKTRRMIAREVAVAVGAQGWEVQHLRRLSLVMLRRLAAKTVPGFRAVETEDQDEAPTR